MSLRLPIQRLARTIVQRASLARSITSEAKAPAALTSECATHGSLGRQAAHFTDGRRTPDCNRDACIRSVRVG